MSLSSDNSEFERKPPVGDPPNSGPPYEAPFILSPLREAPVAELAPTEAPRLPPGNRSGENPPWTGWDVLQIGVLSLVAVFVFLLATAYVAKRVIYPRMTFGDVAQTPLVTVAAQFIAYLLVFAFMVAVVRRDGDGGQSFWSAMKWNPPTRWKEFLGAGVLLSLALQGLAHLLPMPNNLPIDKFFQTPAEAWVLSIFGMTFAPLLEELFFRGFLYPVLARRLGVVLSVFLTAAAFGLIHAPQLGRAWGPVLIVFLVGLVLTICRAITQSVASGVLIHIAYNGTISVLLFIGSGGFRHLERLNS